MVDISMCDGAACDRRDTCFRHVATPAFRQTYFAVSPMMYEGYCDAYIPTKGEETVPQLGDDKGA